MRRSEWTRTTKRADRALYVLRWPQTHMAYAGQTVDPKRRWGEHRRGGWARCPADLQVVCVVPQATEAEAEDWEHAIRWAVSRCGWGVYSLPPGYRIRRLSWRWSWWWLSWKVQGRVRRALSAAAGAPSAA